MRDIGAILSKNGQGNTSSTGRNVAIQDAPIGMIELTHRDKTVLRQMFEAIGNFNGILGEVRDDPVDHKYLARVIEGVAVHMKAIEKALDEFAKEWGYE